MTLSSLFIDTGAFYAKYVPRDEHHAEALLLWKTIADARLRCFTSNYVVTELLSLFVYRFGTEKALQAAREIQHSKTIQILYVTKEIDQKAIGWIERFKDQSFSLTDAASFALMAEKRLKTAFTFDHHFEIAGYNRYS